MNSPLSLPPFGFMASHFQSEVPVTAPGWAQTVLDFSQDHVWPQWDHASHQWQGSSTKNMFEVTRVDLTAIWALKTKLTEFAQNASTDGPQTHGGLFVTEDDLPAKYVKTKECTLKSGIGVPLEMRLQWALKCTDDTAARMAEKFRSGSRSVSSGLFWLKWSLQRPRPNQASFLTGIAMDKTQPKPAWSAWSPSAISGHALQGLVGCLYAATDESPAFLPALHQLAVDIGDRRVFAGVHYPTDNLLSWLAAWEFAKFQKESRFWDASQEAAAHQFIRSAVAQSALLEHLRKHSAYPTWQGCLPDLLPP